MSKPQAKDSYRVYCGIDVAKKTSVVAALPTTDKIIEPFDISNDDKGIKRVRRTLERNGIQPADILVVLEPTGTYYLPVATGLYRAGYDVVVINSLTARRHIQAMLEQNKTDKIDAMRLAEIGGFGRGQLTLWQEPPEIYEQLRQRLRLRDALVDMRAKQRTRYHAAQGRESLADVDAQRKEVIAYIDDKAKSLEKEMGKLLLAHPEWGDNARYLNSIKGFGVYTVTALMVYTINFTMMDSADQLASFVGVVPRKYESGQTSYARIGFSSVPHLRRNLYMCTFSAVRYNPIIRDYYNGMINRGKGRQKTRIACMRKLLSIAWGCVHNQTMFDPEFHQKRKSMDGD